MNKWSLCLFNFFRHYKSPLFHIVIRIHLISLSYHILVILPSYFCSMEQILMLNVIHAMSETASAGLTERSSTLAPRHMVRNYRFEP